MEQSEEKTNAKKDGIKVPESLPSILKELPEKLEVSTFELEELVGEEEVIDYHIAKDLPKEIESEFEPILKDLVAEIYLLTKKSLLSYEIKTDSKIRHIVSLNAIDLMCLYEGKNLLAIRLFLAPCDFFIFGTPKDKEKIERFFKALRNIVGR